MNESLTIGMATYDDYDGVYFTIQSLRMHHNLTNVEFIVLDNNPTSKHGKETKRFIEDKVKGKYIPYTDKQTSFSKYEILKHATKQYYIGLDCHVLLVNNSIDSLSSYFKDHPNCKDIIQGPLLYDDFKHKSTHFEPEWRGGMYGKWGTDNGIISSGVTSEIPMNGMGLFACEIKNWPGINSNFKGFGGEEWYIQEKFRQNGGKCICLPDLLWMHRFGRPNGVPFPNTWEDRLLNYYIGWLELYKDPNHPMITSITDHFKTFLSEKIVDDVFEKSLNL